MTLMSLLIQNAYIQNNQSTNTYTYYIGTGIITDILRQDRYVLQTS